MNKYTCFVISPIGKEGTELYQDYKDLMELIIVPALEVYDIKVSRGDHFITEEKIDTSVIQKIQDADICICDITEQNPNVYYELGRRDETGKPVLLLKRKGAQTSPVDIATRRYFEYDWDNRHGIRDAQTAIRNFVEPLIEQGFEDRGKSATLSDIAQTLSRLERKLDRITSGVNPNPVPGTGTGFGTGTSGKTDVDPVNKLRFALRSRNIPLAEEAMQQLQYRMDKIKFYDQVVEQVAAMGSKMAGEMAVEMAEEFFDSDVSFHKKVEYLGCLVSYLGRADKEQEGLELVQKLCSRLEGEADGEDPEDVAQIYNQPNRLYYGIYINTDDVKWLNMAVEALQKALQIDPEEEAFYFNLSTCYYAYSEATGDRSYYEKARDAIEACLARDKEPDENHLKTACRIYRALDDEKLGDTLAAYAKVDPYGAQLLADSWK